jgi:vacuolar protein sorting-associated protein 54
MVQMSKITAVLDQETWVSVDPPDEFQAILDMFAQEQVVDNGNLGSQETAEIDYTLASETSLSNVASEAMTGSPEVIGIKRHNSVPSEVMEKQGNLGDADKAEVSQTTLPGDLNSFQTSHQDVNNIVTNGVGSKTVKNILPLESEDVMTASSSLKSKKSKDKVPAKTLDFRGIKFHTVNR